MKAIERFALVQHHGPYENWPEKNPVIIDGCASSLSISGFNLLRQYETAAGYLLVTDFDCPYEEAVCFVLVSQDLETVLSERKICQMYRSFWLDEVVWLDEANFYATSTVWPSTGFISAFADLAFLGSIHDWDSPAGA